MRLDCRSTSDSLECHINSRHRIPTFAWLSHLSLVAKGLYTTEPRPPRKVMTETVNSRIGVCRVKRYMVLETLPVMSTSESLKHSNKILDFLPFLALANWLMSCHSR